MNKEEVMKIFNSNGEDLFDAIENGNHKKTEHIPYGNAPPFY